MTIWAILVLTAALVLASCGGEDDDNNNNNNGPNLTNGNLGKTLTISGKQVYYEYFYPNPFGEVYFTSAPYYGEGTVYAGYDDAAGSVVITQEVGTISNGILNLSIGTPTHTIPIAEEYFNDISELYKNFSISNPNAKVIDSRFFVADKTQQNRWISLGRDSWITDYTPGYIIYIYYYYFDRDVRVTGQGTTTVFGGVPDIIITTNIDLQFKKGWNALCWIYSAPEEDEDSEIWSLYVGDSPDILWGLRY